MCEGGTHGIALSPESSFKIFVFILWTLHFECEAGPFRTTELVVRCFFINLHVGLDPQVGMLRPLYLGISIETYTFEKPFFKKCFVNCEFLPKCRELTPFALKKYRVCMRQNRG